MTEDELDERLRRAVVREYADEQGTHPSWERSPARLRAASARSRRGQRLSQGLAAGLLVLVVGWVLMLAPRVPMAGDVPRDSDSAAARTSRPVSVAPASFSPSPEVTPFASVAPSPSTAPTIPPSVAPEASPTPSVPPIYGPEFGEDLPEAPPPVTVRAGDTTFGLRAWSYCYMDGCVDGYPGPDVPDVGDVTRVEIDFPLDDWAFQASFVPVGVACPRYHSVAVAKTGDHTYVVEPAGFADTYDVTLSGRGNGSVAVSFRWSTPHDGPLQVPEARLGILSGDEADVSGSGVELSLSGLRATPRSASAEVTVTAANGRSLSFEPELDTRPDGCFGEGVVYWDGPDKAALRAKRLGPAPFTYDVVVVLDGERYAARAVWPADEIKEISPSVGLDFSPPLPALTTDDRPSPAASPQGRFYELTCGPLEEAGCETKAAGIVAIAARDHPGREGVHHLHQPVGKL